MAEHPTPRTCRYGHGNLLKIDQIRGEPLQFGILGMHDGANLARTRAVGGLNWYLCTTCGYSELIDGDVAATIAHMQSIAGESKPK